MSAEENKAVLRRWIEAYNERDLEIEAAVLARDYVAHVPAAPGPLEGLEAWRQFSGSFAEACSLTFGSRRRTSCRSSTRLRRGHRRRDRFGCHIAWARGALKATTLPSVEDGMEAMRKAGEATYRRPGQ